MARLRRADCSGPGITRKRAGRGFAYYDDGVLVGDQEVLERIRGLGIPPAWKDVWICPYANGHLQATGIDAAGRKQYRYHEAWRTRRDAQKFDDMTRFARALPALRARVEADLAATDELTRERVLACAVRLLDRGFFRIGTEEYTATNESYGLATIRKEHVKIDGEQMIFDYPAKSGQRRIQAVVDPARQGHGLHPQAPARRRAGPARLQDGRQWLDVRSDDINQYLKDATGDDFSAKDFRTWSATVLAAVALSVSGSAHGSQDLTPAREDPRDQGDRALPRQHARGLPRVLHRPAHLRRLRRRPRARPPGAARRGRARPAADPPPGDRSRGARPAQREGRVTADREAGGLRIREAILQPKWARAGEAGRAHEAPRSRRAAAAADRSAEASRGPAWDRPGRSALGARRASPARAARSAWPVPGAAERSITPPSFRIRRRTTSPAKSG